MIIINFNSVNDLSIVCYYLKEFAWFGACGYLGLVVVLPELSPERTEH